MHLHQLRPELFGPGGERGPTLRVVRRAGEPVHLFDPALDLLGVVDLVAEPPPPGLGRVVVLLLELVELAAVLDQLQVEPAAPLLDRPDDSRIARDAVPLGERRAAAMGQRAEPVEDGVAREALALELEQPEQATAGEALADGPAFETDPGQPGGLQRFSDELLVRLGTAIGECGAVEWHAGLEPAQDGTHRRPDLFARVGGDQDGLSRPGLLAQGGELVPTPAERLGPAGRLGVGLGIFEPGQRAIDGCRFAERLEQVELGHGQTGWQEQEDRSQLTQ